MMQITFMGATRTVTGSKYLVNTGTKKIMVDCGLFQGGREVTVKNKQTLQVSPETIDAVILTHAHIDHSGYLPLLIKNGFNENIYCSEATRDLCSILLPDCAYLQEEEAKRENLHAHSNQTLVKPLYAIPDAMRTLNHFHPIDFGSEFEIPKVAKFTLYPAGHIVGASFIMLRSHGISILFSGDIGRMNDYVMYPPEIIEQADYLVLESTYGHHLHNNINPLDTLADIINHTIKKRGTVVLPAFAVARSQCVLYLIHQLQKSNRIPKVPIYLDSPMAIEATEIFCKYGNETRLGKKLAREVARMATFVTSTEESQALSNNKNPKIIISASGMVEGGRVLNHLKQFLPNANNTIVLTGFQAVGTRGESLLKGEKLLNIEGEFIPVNADIKFLNNISSHADYDEILSWLSNFKHPPKKVFIVHGEPAANEGLKQKIQERFGWDCIIPEYLQTEKLE